MGRGRYQAAVAVQAAGRSLAAMQCNECNAMKRYPIRAREAGVSSEVGIWRAERGTPTTWPRLGEGELRAACGMGLQSNNLSKIGYNKKPRGRCACMLPAWHGEGSGWS